MIKRFLQCKEQYAPAHDIEVPYDGDIINVYLCYNYPPHYCEVETMWVVESVLAHTHKSRDLIASVVKSCLLDIDIRELVKL